MADNRQVLIHLHTPDVKMPTSNVIELGEIAVQHNDAEAALYIKKNNGDIAKFIDVIAIDAKLANYATSADTVNAIAVETLRAEGAEGALSDRIEALEGASGQLHVHTNKDVIDGISAEKVAAWDSAEQNAKDYADGLAGNYDAAGAADAAEAAAKAYADGLAGNYDAAGAADAAEAAAKAYADGLAGNYDAAGAADAAEAAAKAYADGLAGNYDAAGVAAGLVEAHAAEASHITGDERVAWNSAKAAIDAFLKDADMTEKAVDTLAELQTYMTEDGAAAAELVNRVANLEAIDHEAYVGADEVVLTNAKNYTNDEIAKLSYDAAGAADAAEAAAKAYADGLAGNYDAAGAADAAEAAAKAYADGLAGNYDAAGAADAAEAAAKAYADGLAGNYDAAGAADAAEAAAKAYADGLAGNYDAAGAADAAEAAAKAYADGLVSVDGEAKFDAAGAADAAESAAKSYVDEKISAMRIDCGTF